MDARLLLPDLRDTVIAFVILSPFLIALSVDTLKYYAVVRQASRQDLEDFLAHLPKPVQRFYLSNVREVYSNKHSAQQMITTFKVRRYMDSILPLGFIVATPVVWIRTLQEG